MGRFADTSRMGGRREVTVTHDMTGTKTWWAYHHAKQRCNNPRHQKYLSYGGRGILMLFTSFNDWFAGVGPAPSPLHEIDRIDNDGHYEHGNVRWVTRSVNQLNRRKPKVVRVECACGTVEYKVANKNGLGRCKACVRRDWFAKRRT